MTPSRLRLLYLASRAATLLESVVAAFWPALCLMAVFVSLALFNIPHLAGPGLWGLFIVLFMFLLTMAILHGRARFHLPAPEALWRRIERENNLIHGPLTALRDRPAKEPDALSTRLWKRHLDQGARQLADRRLHPVCPAPQLALRDPLALRFAALLALIVAVVVAGGDWETRLAAGIAPPQTTRSAPALTLDAWITPPAYTGLSPIMLAGNKAPPASAGILNVPVNSVLSVRLAGRAMSPKVVANGQTLPMQSVADNNWRLETPLTSGDTLRIRCGWWPLESRNIRLIPDLPPVIGLAGEIGTDEKNALQIPYAASDDYPLARVRTIISRPSGQDGGPAETLEIPVAPSLPDGKTSILTASHDLTSHPWSGLPVKIRMTATDAAGQTAETEEKDFVLPERQFTHPVARRIIDDRRALITANTREVRQAAGISALSLAEHPQAYKGDWLAMLALDVAGWRLLLDKTGLETGSVIDLLWKTAVRIDDSGLSVARSELKKALDELVEKLSDRTADAAELEALMKKMEQALAEYARSLSEEMKRAFAGHQPRPLPPELMQRLAQRIDMDKVMDHLRNMAAGDQREAMQKFLQQMSRMVENLDPKAMREQQEAQERQMQKLEGLAELIRSQQELLDKTNRLSSKADAPADTQDPGPDLAKRQNALSTDLDGLSKQIGENGAPTPAPFERARTSMGEAAGDLASGDLPASIPHQQQALRELNDVMNQSLDEMARAMEEMMMSMGFMPFGAGMGGGMAGGDPLGRAEGQGRPFTSDVGIPDAEKMRRVQEIIRELRRRSGEPNRPRLEKNYIDRLLKQF